MGMQLRTMNRVPSNLARAWVVLSEWYNHTQQTAGTLCSYGEQGSREPWVLLLDPTIRSCGARLQTLLIGRTWLTGGSHPAQEPNRRVSECQRSYPAFCNARTRASEHGLKEEVLPCVL